MKFDMKGCLDTPLLCIMCFSLKSNKRVCGSNAWISFPPNYISEKTVEIPFIKSIIVGLETNVTNLAL